MLHDGKHLRLDVEQTAQREEIKSVKMAAWDALSQLYNFSIEAQ